MPFLTNLDLLEPSLTLLDFPLFYYQEPRLSFPLNHLIDPRPCLSDAIASPFEPFESILDLTHILDEAPLSSSFRKIRPASGCRSLYDRVSALDSVAFDPVAVNVGSDRKYTWTAEIKCPEKKWWDQKYKSTAEIKGSEVHRKYKWTVEIDGREDRGVDRKYKWIAGFKGGKNDELRDAIKGAKHKEISIKIKEPESGAGVCVEGHRKKATRLVEIDEPLDQGSIYLRRAFGKRAGAIAKARGKAKLLSPQDAALIIQISFRAYLIRRSQALRSLRELAIGKAKLKEIRVLFNNFSYRGCIARDGEERKRFAERIIALLLSVDAIQDVDLMVRAARRLMLDELEAMLDVVDPPPAGKLGFLKGRKFALPENSIEREMAAGVADVVQMLDQAAKSDDGTLGLCL